MPITSTQWRDQSRSAEPSYHGHVFLVCLIEIFFGCLIHNIARPDNWYNTKLFPKFSHQFTLPPAINECSHCSKFLIALSVCLIWATLACSMLWYLLIDLLKFFTYSRPKPVVSYMCCKYLSFCDLLFHFLFVSFCD